MDCKKASNYFFDFVEHQLNEHIEKNFQYHLDECPSCQSKLVFFKNTLNSIDASRDRNPEVSFHFTEKTLFRIESLQRESTLWQWIYSVLFRKVSVITASFVAVFAGIVLGILFNSSKIDNTSQLSSAEQSLEEVYMASTSEDYMIQFFDNQYFIEDGNK